MSQWRACGVLLHLTSLPNQFGIGDLGQSAYDFIDFLAAAKQSYWQILPLGPTDQFHSPYTPYSAFAGNPLLISLEKLINEQLLSVADLQTVPTNFSQQKIDFAQLLPWKSKLLSLAFQNYLRRKPTKLVEEYTAFCKDNQFWLIDFALFMTLKQQFNNQAWYNWPPEIARRQTQAIQYWRQVLSDEIAYHQFIQYLFFKQWQQLKAYAHKQGIKIIGDLPIFVAHDSADVWVHPFLFKLNSDGQPTVVAGVPPDYFSPTGQLWGNPLYKWEAHQEQNYDWWLKRLSLLLSLVDLVRIDHFRGFESAWEIPHGETTAVKGAWQKGPGSKFFQVVVDQFDDLPFIAEDLGFITEEVIQLRDQWSLPGMKILQFAFDSLQPNPHLPHYHQYNSVVYTGTHDNDTSFSWYQKLSSEIKAYVKNYLNSDGTDIVWDLIRAAYASPAKLAIIPLQDLLRLDSQARMNRPGQATGNWTWRYEPQLLTEQLIADLSQLATLYQRVPNKK